MIGALAVVTARNLFYAALGLLVSLAAVAGIYITLDADFLALAQFLIYVGGIAVLIVFAVMMTAQINRASNSARLWPLGLLTGAATLAGLAYIMINTDWRSEGRGETISRWSAMPLPPGLTSRTCYSAPISCRSSWRDCCSW